jgi:rSAM-partnered protein
MTDTSDDEDYQRVGEPRSSQSPAWETFVRTDAGEPLRHVGSVEAPTEQAALERASQLFDATAIWLCPADAVSRYATPDLTSDSA